MTTHTLYAIDASGRRTVSRTWDGTASPAASRTWLAAEIAAGRLPPSGAVRGTDGVRRSGWVLDAPVDHRQLTSSQKMDVEAAVLALNTAADPDRSRQDALERDIERQLKLAALDAEIAVATGQRLTDLQAIRARVAGG